MNYKLIVLILALTIVMSASNVSAWWDSDYTYSYQLTIVNSNGTDAIEVGTPIIIDFNHSASLTAGNCALNNGNDLRVIYQDTTELNRIPDSSSGFKQTNSKIVFPLKAQIGAGATDSTNYKVYCGNALAVSPLNNISAIFDAMNSATAFWGFNTPLYEDKKAGMNLTTSGSVNINTTHSKWGNSTYIAGNDDFLEHATFLDTYDAYVGKGLIMDVWVLDTSESSGGETIVGKINSGASTGESWGLVTDLTSDNGTIVYSKIPGEAFTDVFNSRTVGTFRHVIMRWYPNYTITLWQNGIPTIRNLNTTRFPTNMSGGNDFQIGVWNDATWDFLGNIDAMGFYVGNFTDKQLNALYIRDTEYPTLTWLEPAPAITVGTATGDTSLSITTPTATTYYTSSIELNWSTTGITLNESWYSLDGASNVSINSNITIPVTNGSYTIDLFVNNSIGKIYTANVTFTVSWLVNITITSPINNTYYAPPGIPLIYDYTSLGTCDSIRYNINGTGWNTTSCGNQTIPYTISGDYYIDISINNTYGYSDTDTYIFNISNPIVACSTPASTYAVNFTFYDEDNLTTMNADADYTINVFTTNYNFSYNVSVANTGAFQICTNGGPWNADMILEYSEDGYATRFYFFDNASLGTSTNVIPLYLLETGHGAVISVDVQDAIGYPLDNVYVKFQRYYIGEDVYRTVAMLKSDDSGNGYVYLDNADVWYKYAISQYGATLRIIGPVLVSGTDLIIRTSSGIALTWNDYNTGIDHSCSYSDATQYIACIYNDASNLATNICLLAETYNVMNVTTYAETCDTSTSGTLLIDTSTASSLNQSLIYTLYITVDGEDIQLYRDSIKLDGSSIYGDMGMLLMIIIFCICAGAGLYNPAVTIITGVMGIVGAFIFGFVDLNILSIGTIVVIGGIIAYKVKT